jgi:cytochrome c nitrite reductase small subunit
MKARTWLAVALGASLGIAVGIGGYTFGYARGASYFTSDPAACANCHVMREQYAGWLKSSHHGVATCNDCHTPPGTIPKYLTKASNGFWHSFYFTTGDFPEPIQIRPRNRAVTEAACRKCHQEIVEAIDLAHVSQAPARARDRVECLRCHDSVGHGAGHGAGHGGGLGPWDLAATSSEGNDDE